MKWNGNKAEDLHIAYIGGLPRQQCAAGHGRPSCRIRWSVFPWKMPAACTKK